MANLTFASPPSSMSDKDCGIFLQSYNDPCNDLFDQFLDLDSLDAEVASFPHPPSSTVQARPRSISNSAGTLREDQAGCQSASLELRYKHSAASRSEGPSRCHSQQGGSGRAAISDTELLNLEGIRIQSPHLAPLTPSLQSTILYPLTPATTGKRHRILDISGSRTQRKPSSHRRIASLHQVKARQDPDCQRSSIRKITSPAKMMRTQQYSEQSLHEWSQRLAEEAKSFQFDFSNPARPLSPPPSARVSDASADNQSIMRVSDQHHGFVWDHPVPQYTSRSHQAEMQAQLPTPEDSTYSFHQHPHARGPSIDMSSPHAHHPSTWSQNPLSTEYPFNGPTSADYADDSDSPVWWGQTTSGPLAQPAPVAYHSGANSTKTQTLALQLQSQLAYNANELALSPSGIPSGGLMIHNLPPSPTGQSYVVVDSVQGSSPNHHAMSFYNQQHHQHSHSGTSIHGAASPKHRYAQSHQLESISTQGLSFGALEVRKSRAIERDSLDDDEGDDSPSPTSGTPRRSSNASFAPNRQRRSVSRRNLSAHSSRSASVGRRTPKMSSTSSSHGSRNPGSGLGKGGGGAAGAGVDFVNFTPSDSMKILTGVAPSGSSKTKARREKEAMEKRRRLSLAAVRAVKAAGGSIEGLLLEEDGGLLD